MHYEVLDEKRQALLPALGRFKEDFYLAGGTALALQIGHRVSVDFDFFTEKDFETEDVYEQVQEMFGQVPRTQESHRTLAVVVQEDVKVSFMGYRYPLIEACTDTEHLRLASILDIGCMKLVLKALVSFEDVPTEPVDFIEGNKVTFAKIQETIIKSVKSVPLGIR